MGTDIWPIVQIRRGEVWETVPWVEHKAMHRTLTDRCYLLFGVLAGVRCYEVTPAAPPRGLPLDLGFNPNRALDDTDSDRFLGEGSYSWVTLRELEQYPWEGLRWHVHQGCASTYRDHWPHVQRFLDLVLPWLRSLGSSDDVRLVYGFD